MANIVQVVINGVNQSDRAFAKAKSDLVALERLAKTAAVAFAGLAVAGVAQAGRELISFGREAIDAADEIGKLAQRAGIAVEDFSKLSYSTKLAEVDASTFQTAIRNLSDDLVKTGRGSADIVDEILKVSDQFAAAGDGATKTALAVKTFGRAGQEMIPFLNQGSTAIREQMQEAERLGLVISKDFARQADQFNDNLERIHASFKGVSFQLAERALPSLNRWSEALVRLSQDKEKVGFFFDGIATSLKAQFLWLNAVGPLLDKFADKMGVARNGAADPAGGGGLFDPEHIKRAQEMADKMTQMSLRGLAAIQGAEKEAHRKRLADIDEFQISAEEKTRLRENSESLLQQRLTEIHRQGLDNRATLDHLYREGEVTAYIEYSQKYAAIEQASLEARQQFLQSYEFFAQESNRKMFSYIAEGSRLVYDDLSSSIAKVVTGQQKASEAAKQLGVSLAESVVKWMAQRAIAFALEKTLSAGALALQKAQFTATVAQAAGLAAAHAPGATAALVSTFGAASAFGALLPPMMVANASLASAMALAGGLGGVAHGGLDYVPRESTYLLDKGERVLSPSQNVELTEFLQGGGRGQVIHNHIHLEGREILSFISEASRDGRLVIDSKSVE